MDETHFPIADVLVPVGDRRLGCRIGRVRPNVDPVVSYPGGSPEVGALPAAGNGAASCVTTVRGSMRLLLWFLRLIGLQRVWTDPIERTDKLIEEYREHCKARDQEADAIREKFLATHRPDEPR